MKQTNCIANSHVGGSIFFTWLLREPTKNTNQNFATSIFFLASFAFNPSEFLFDFFGEHLIYFYLKNRRIDLMV